MTGQPRERSGTTSATSATSARSPVRALGLAFGGAIAAGGLWYALSVATGLIFHFMPGAPFLASAAVFRWTVPERPARWAEVASILLGGSIVTAAGLIAIPASGGSLDEPALIVLVVAVGAALALVWLRRAPRAGGV